MNEKSTQIIMNVTRQTDGGHNPGALHVAMEIATRYGLDVLEKAHEQGVTGEELWIFHKYVCDENVDITFLGLMSDNARGKLASIPVSKYFIKQEEQ